MRPPMPVAVSSHGDTSLSQRLHCAAARGHVSTLCKLLGAGANPNWYDPVDGLTSLQIAALEGRAACVYHLLLAGADLYATLSQGCTALDLFIEHKIFVRVLDKFFWTRNYKRCLAYLEVAHDDCQSRIHAVTDYQGIVVLHPNDELGLVCAEAHQKCPLCVPAGRPIFADDGSAMQNAARPTRRPLAVVLPPPMPMPMPMSISCT